MAPTTINFKDDGDGGGGYNNGGEPRLSLVALLFDDPDGRLVDLLLQFSVMRKYP